MNTAGKLLKILAASRFELVNIFDKQNPFLLAVISTAKGNGGHEIYKACGDSLQNVYEGYYNFQTRTYDGLEDDSVFEPAELKVTFMDLNKDGFKDLMFTGERLTLGKYTPDFLWYDVEDNKSFTITNPASKTSVRYIFYYDSKTGHFK